MKALFGSFSRATLAIACILASPIAAAQSSPTAEEVHAEMFSKAGPKLELRDDGLVYKEGAKQPYSGTIDKSRGEEHRYVDGVLEALIGRTKLIFLDGTQLVRRITYGANKLPTSDEIIFEGKDFMRLFDQQLNDPSSVSMPDVDALPIDESGLVYAEWFENGQMSVSLRYINGECCLLNHWYENGQKRMEIHSADRTAARMWDENGVEVEE